MISRQGFLYITAICFSLFLFIAPVNARSNTAKFIASWDIVRLSEAAYIETKPVKNLTVNIAIFPDGNIGICIFGKKNGDWKVETFFNVTNCFLSNTYLTDQTDFNLEILDSENLLFGKVEILLGHTADIKDYISFSLPRYNLFLEVQGSDSKNINNLIKLYKAFVLLNSGQLREDEVYDLF